MSDHEYASLRAAACAEGWACGAFAAHAALAAARSAPLTLTGEVRAALTKLMETSRRVEKVGVNLNQAVARLNATGQRSDDLGAIAAYCARAVAHVDEAAAEMATELRKKSV